MSRRLPSAVRDLEPASPSLESSRLTLDFSGRVCLVTGGGQGIGRAIARAFAAHGAAVVVTDLSRDRSDEVAREIGLAGRRAVSLAADVADRHAIGNVIAACEEQFGALDILVHNAAHFPLREFAAIDPELLEKTLAVNLKAAFWLAQAALPLLRRSKQARVLVTSSVTGPRIAYPGLAHYAASKAGLNGFIRAAALELSRSGITVNGVEPGMIATAASENLGNDEHQRLLERAVPLGRLGRAEEIASAMLFLASDAAAYITGQTLVVDGGALLPECGLSLAN
jgi:3-oxoacyl-[acyl-carrier protein] reductase